MKIKTSIIAAFLCWTLAGCIKEITPSDAITTSSLVQTKEGLTHAVNGAYSLFKDHIEFNGTTDLNLMYLRQYFQMSDFASDDIVCGQVTTDPFFLSFTLNHTPTQTNARYFWYISYKIINDANTVIEAAEKIANPDASIKQLIGECYFIRAFCHFNLARFYAKPYSVDPNAPGIILRLSIAEDGQKARATVKEVYNAIAADAEKAASLMNQPRGVQYASKEAAWALLSRTFLYEENHDSTIFYSNKVINSCKFSLENA
ncbi:MAG: RagB/SusD family nutrient uptake outer membrane protein, partial [Ginsengibacter sp.]